MKSVLISIQPKWCELIASGKKTIEVRKTRPKFETPFKCYIYCTKSTDRLLYFSCNDKVLRTTKSKYIHSIERTCKIFSGKVIGEFMCDRITTLVHVGTMGNSKLELVIRNSDGSDSQLTEKWISKTCLSLKELENYSKGGDLYGWHISNLTVYDKPKGLREFIVQTFPKSYGCCNNCLGSKCKFFEAGYGYMEDDCNATFDTDEFKPLTRPPQSWCYVEG